MKGGMIHATTAGHEEGMEPGTRCVACRDWGKWWRREEVRYATMPYGKEELRVRVRVRGRVRYLGLRFWARSSSQKQEVDGQCNRAKD